MIKIAWDIHGLQSELLRWGSEMAGALAGGLFEAATQVMLDSAMIVPVDTGRLRDSAFVEKPRSMAGTSKINFGYCTPYAHIPQQGMYFYSPLRRMQTNFRGFINAYLKLISIGKKVTFNALFATSARDPGKRVSFKRHRQR